MQLRKSGVYNVMGLARVRLTDGLIQFCLRLAFAGQTEVCRSEYTWKRPRCNGRHPSHRSGVLACGLRTPSQVLRGNMENIRVQYNELHLVSFIRCPNTVSVEEDSSSAFG